MRSRIINATHSDISGLARFDVPGIFHHSVGRGIERKEIFYNDMDRSDILDRLWLKISSNWAAIPGQVTSRLDDLVKKNLRPSGQRIDIIASAQQMFRKYDISTGELPSGSRRRLVVEAHGSISWIAVREFGYSGTDVARY